MEGNKREWNLYLNKIAFKFFLNVKTEELYRRTKSSAVKQGFYLL